MTSVVLALIPWAAQKQNSFFYTATVRFKNVSNCLNTNIYSYLETSGAHSSNLYLNAVHFFNNSVN